MDPHHDDSSSGRPPSSSSPHSDRQRWFRRATTYDRQNNSDRTSAGRARTVNDVNPYYLAETIHPASAVEAQRQEQRRRAREQLESAEAQVQNAFDNREVIFTSRGRSGVDSSDVRAYTTPSSQAPLQRLDTGSFQVVRRNPLRSRSPLGTAVGGDSTTSRRYATADASDRAAEDFTVPYRAILHPLPPSHPLYNGPTILPSRSRKRPYEVDKSSDGGLDVYDITTLRSRPIMSWPQPEPTMLRSDERDAIRSQHVQPLDRRPSGDAFGGGERPQESQGRIVLPRWQPDSEVDACPVCGMAFSFYYRRHHCRKCGRVVCGQCSPHRITIPKQFIVYPPSGGDSDEPESPRRSSGYHSHAVGGSQEVRVCNPCVPDPNYSPPPQQQYQGPPSYDTLSHGRHPLSNHERHPPRPFTDQDRAVGPNQHHHVARPRFTSFDQLNSPSFSYTPTLPPHSSRPVSTPYHRQHASANELHPSAPSEHPNYRRSFVGQIPAPHPHPPAGLSGAYMPLDLSHPSASGRSPYGQSLPTGRIPSTTSRSSRTRPRAADSGAFAAYHPPAQEDHPGSFRRLASTSASRLTPSPPVQRPIAEEDECPVCGNELPSKGPSGEEHERERHIEQCIASYGAGATVSAEPDIPQITAASPGMVVPSRSSSHGAGTPSSAPHGSSLLARRDLQGRPRAETSAAGLAGTAEVLPRRRATANRMVQYVATEKDCVDDEGATGAECIICLEEFEPGQEMGRLICLCKFHRRCITTWWETKGIGSCPTHQFHE